MRKDEKELVFELCKFRNEDSEKIKDLICRGFDTPSVLGYLFFHRMASVAYGVLFDCNLLKYTNRDFRNPLKNAYLQNKIKNESYFSCVQILSDILEDSKGKYAMLKGAYLCKWYPEGYRTSNDIDILVESKDITFVGEKLSAAGFRQGHIKEDIFVSATRQEIITSKMMRGETVPYIAEVNLPYMKYMEVDLNYSLDYKNGLNDIVSDLISKAQKVEIGHYQITTLSKYDFVIHLCEHLYKEATTYPWIKMKRDMTLYKFCDLYTMLYDYSGEDFEQLEKRLIQLKLEPICYYALYLTRVLFSIKNKNLNGILDRIAPKDKTILNFVISPSDKKIYRYENDDICKRFFASDRTAMLRTVNENA